MIMITTNKTIKAVISNPIKFKDHNKTINKILQAIMNA